MVLYEFSALSAFDVLGLVGVMVFAGIQALRHQRVIGGDGLVFFAGNTVAAALVMSSNFGGLHALWLLAQIAVIALIMIAMIAQFFDAPERG